MENRDINKKDKKIIRAEFIKLVINSSKREVIQEIISQLKKSGIQLTENDSRALYISLLSSNCTSNLTEIIYKNIESKIKDVLYEANSCGKVTLNFIKGIIITATKIPKRKKINNFTGKREMFKAYVKPKAEFSKVFTKSISK